MKIRVWFIAMLLNAVMLNVCYSACKGEQPDGCDEGQHSQVVGSQAACISCPPQF